MSQAGAMPPAVQQGQNMTPAQQEMNSLLQELWKSIQEGHSEQAKVLAARLALMHPAAGQQPATPAPPQEPEIRVKVYVEDKESSGSFVVLKLRPSMTIAELKRKSAERQDPWVTCCFEVALNQAGHKMLLDFQFPEEVQRWVIGKKLPKDDETLSKHGIKTNGASIYLYLYSARSVGLTRRKFRQQLDQLTGAAQAPVAQPVPPASRIQEPPTGGAEALPLPAQLHRPVPPVQPPPPAPEPEPEGWKCPVCTYLNQPLRPGCEMCSADCPDDYKPPVNYQPKGTEQKILREMAQQDELAQKALKADQERERNQARQNFQNLQAVAQLKVVENDEEFTCPICFDDIEPGQGVVLQECLHKFCKGCLAGHIQYHEEADITCPFQDNDYHCEAQLLEREIKALVTPEVYNKHLQRGLQIAENQEANSFHCKTPDCPGWCIYEDEVNTFPCQLCGKPNCLTCKAIHEGMNCKQYQEDLRIRAENDVTARQTKEWVEKLVRDGEAMHCPGCKIILQKKMGCDWLRCTMCKMEICWVTRGPRWGPRGNGDTSGGCRCRVAGPCHPNCGNCH